MPYTRLQEATEGLFERRDQLAEQNANLVRTPNKLTCCFNSEGPELGHKQGSPTCLL